MKTGRAILLATIFTGTVAFFIGVLIARVFPGGDSKPLFDLVTAAVGAFAGTTAGAWIAFTSDRLKRERELEDKAVTAANLVLFQLGRLYAYLWDYKESVVHPFSLNPAIWYHIPRSSLSPPDFGVIDFSGIAFLFESNAPNIPNSVAIQFVRFSGFLNIMRVAQDYSRKAVALVGAATPQDYSVTALEKTCGPQLTESLRSTTNSLIDFSEKLEADVFAVTEHMARTISAMYPHRKIYCPPAPKRVEGTGGLNTAPATVASP